MSLLLGRCLTECFIKPPAFFGTSSYRWSRGVRGFGGWGDRPLVFPWLAVSPPLPAVRGERSALCLLIPRLQNCFFFLSSFQNHPPNPPEKPCYASRLCAAPASQSHNYVVAVGCGSGKCPGREAICREKRAGNAAGNCPTAAYRSLDTGGTMSARESPCPTTCPTAGYPCGRTQDSLLREPLVPSRQVG